MMLKWMYYSEFLLSLVILSIGWSPIEYRAINISAGLIVFFYSLWGLWMVWNYDTLTEEQKLSCSKMVFWTGSLVEIVVLVLLILGFNRDAYEETAVGLGILVGYCIVNFFLLFASCVAINVASSSTSSNEES